VGKRAKCHICGDPVEKGCNICGPCYDHHFGPDGPYGPPMTPHPANLTRSAIRICPEPVETGAPLVPSLRDCFRRYPASNSRPGDRAAPAQTQMGHSLLTKHGRARNLPPRQEKSLILTPIQATVQKQREICLCATTPSGAC
jgi:hypothetical protein